MLELNFLTWHAYDAPPDYAFVYCIEAHTMGSALNFDDALALEKCIERTIWEFEERFNSINLISRGWEITNDTLIPPTFNIGEVIVDRQKRMVKFGYPENFDNFNHFKKLIEIPPARKR